MVYQDLDTTFAALADPTRREILARLATGDRTISELAGRFDMSLPAVSKHVRVLQRAGLAAVERHGRVRRARLTADPMRGAAAWIEEYRQFWQTELDQLAAFFENALPPESPSSSPTESPPEPPPPASHASASKRRASASPRRRGSGGRN